MLRRSSLTVAIVILGSSYVSSAELDLGDAALLLEQDPPVAMSVQDGHPDIQFIDLSDSDDDVLRVAQRLPSKRKGVSTATSTPTSSAFGPRGEVAQTEAKKKDSAVDRQLRSLERLLEKEEARLNKTFEDLNRKREAALVKGDEKQLKRIESMEKTAVLDYEKRVNRLLNSVKAKQSSNIRKPVSQLKSAGKSKPRASAPSTLTRSTSRNTTPGLQRGSVGTGRATSRSVKRNSNPKPGEDSKPASQRRRLRFWPFK